MLSHSGSDITLLAKEAAMRPLRRLLTALEPGVYGDAATTAAAEGSGTAGAGVDTADSLQSVSVDDLNAALLVTKPSAQGYERQYAEFSTKFGQG